ncbi:MAG: phosphonate ABC transporter, permease protein PhnE, partial [Bdellovibrionota bacterium]
NDLGSTIRRAIFDGFTFAYLVIFAWVAVFRPESEVLMAELSTYVKVFFGAMALGGILSFWINSRGTKTLGEIIFAPPNRRVASAVPVKLHHTFWGLQVLIVLGVTVVLGVVIAEVSLLKLLEADSFYQAMRLFGELAHPDWSILPKAVLKIIETIFIAFMATAIAVPIAFVLSFVTARNVMASSKTAMTVLTVIRTTLNVGRSVEPVLWAIIFSIWVSFGPFAGMLALMVNSVASLVKQYSEIVEGVDDGPIEGIQSTGATKIQTVWFAIVPQIVLPYISYTMYRWDTNVRMATILGFVGGGGIGVMLIEYQGQAQWPQVGTIILVIAAVVWILDAFSAHVRAAIK